jgi:aminoglycoside 6'-N-acetyltransferase I
MKLTVREMGVADRQSWAEMRAALWPDDTLEAHAKAVDELLGSRENWCLIAETPDGESVGFAEVAVRKYANGCDTQPVAFLEGIWVKPELRRRSVGASLIRYAETLVVECGFQELGSDTLIDNEQSQAAHHAWGFSETERVVYFRKILRATSESRDRTA